jgi:thiol-disulfide isomerase/thioredoxin
MDPLLIVAILAALVTLSTIAGLVLRSREGRLKTSDGLTRVDRSELGERIHFGPNATLLQFSTEFCTKCPGTRSYLAGVAEQNVGVSHIDIDITHRQDLAQKFNIMQTPTTFILDDSGAIAGRIGGAPRPDAVSQALNIALRRDHDLYAI